MYSSTKFSKLVVLSSIQVVTAVLKYSSTAGWNVHYYLFCATGNHTKFSTKFSTVELTRTKLAHQARAADVRGISKIFEKNSCIARATRPRRFDSLPSQDPD